MTDEQSFRVSVIDPIEPAVKKVRDILFSPFDLGKWFIIGFCAWLANLGRGGFGFRFPFDGRRSRENLPAQIHDFIVNNLALVITIGSILLMVGIIVAIVLLWLSSRGKFMFLYCVAQNKAEVKIPWYTCSSQGNSLFLFQLVVGLISLVCIIFCIAAVIAMKMYGIKMIVLIPLLVFIILIFILLILAFSMLFKFTADFVVPIMYLRNCTCLEGWRLFLSMLSNNKGKFILYILFQIVVAIAITIIVWAFACLTCCCACCIMMIPYIGTVLLLPILVFHRAYSLIYLSQYGNQFNVFMPTANVTNAVV